MALLLMLGCARYLTAVGHDAPLGFPLWLCGFLIAISIVVFSVAESHSRAAVICAIPWTVAATWVLWLRSGGI